MRIKALVIKIIQQFFRDKRTLMLMLLAPLFVLTLTALVLDKDKTDFQVGGYQLPDQLVQTLENNHVEVTSYSKNEPKKTIDQDGLDAFISLKKDNLLITLDGSDPSTKEVAAILQKSQTPKQASQHIEIAYAYGSEDLTTFDHVGPVLVGLFIFFFVFLIAGISFLRERTSGTLERILATPLRRWEIVCGYCIGFGLFTTLQTVLITWYSVEILGLYQQGSIWIVLCLTSLLSLTALTLGTFLSTFANNELQLIQFVPLVIVPQVFFSGMFAMDGMADWLQGFSYIMPIYYGADALKLVMMKGQGFTEIINDIVFLLGFVILFASLNILTLKKYRKL
ncbi:ABC transporter permease [Bacillus sp. WMMC1349]|uniref:ABC transporter permease n=1 Tax=Bacillus sp. WMMC1349 TaxID=2736254 RepID=UPI001553BFCF|nr:ABC transporter permease [Bacillus sp. WMMC1349]NPC94382.1 ABC transporter permease [Bacillus sp. WMMC1349]